MTALRVPEDRFTQAAAPGGALDQAVGRAVSRLIQLQKPDGHWAFELEADATIPAEYILLEHYLDEIDEALERRIAAYLRSIQMGHGGWALYHGGPFDISASVKAYYAVRAAGEAADA